MVQTCNDFPMGMKEIDDKRLLYAFYKNLFHCKILYSFGTKQEYIRHTQMRVGFSPLNRHLFRHGLTDHASCACGYEAEDLVHNFLDCPLYTEQRRELIFFCPCYICMYVYTNMLCDLCIKWCSLFSCLHHKEYAYT